MDDFTRKLIDCMPDHLQQIYHQLPADKQEMMLVNLWYQRSHSEHSILAGIGVGDIQ